MNLDDLKEHGGPAFPTHRLQWNYGSEERELETKHLGMTMRDFFAAKAMQGWLSSYGPGDQHPATAGNADFVAQRSYAMADAMLAARGAQ
ncbi:hypothetical protein [Bordetella hinzii]|uniref:N-acetyltransferase YedL n=1 Tax=Bordetella hinzii OH87 BAL007II TaxID=1331262 RepID=A0ABR4R5R0_9BORD|nr:hypothetical protein [Bordetella hinzii]KCB26024.1 hypothetical protein L544_3256 [Bordetella hinzii OH87 BAL007II]